MYCITKRDKNNFYNFQKDFLIFQKNLKNSILYF